MDLRKANPNWFQASKLFSKHCGAMKMTCYPNSLVAQAVRSAELRTKEADGRKIKLILFGDLFFSADIFTAELHEVCQDKNLYRPPMITHTNLSILHKDNCFLIVPLLVMITCKHLCSKEFIHYSHCLLTESLFLTKARKKKNQRAGGYSS